MQRFLMALGVGVLLVLPGLCVAETTTQSVAASKSPVLETAKAKKASEPAASSKPVTKTKSNPATVKNSKSSTTKTTY